MLLSLLLQITSPATDSAAKATTAATETIAPIQDSLSLLDLMMKGGYIMIPIGILSILSIYVLIERYITIKKASKIDDNFMNNVRDFILQGNIDSAKSICKNAQHPVGKMIEKGIVRIGKPMKEIEGSMEAVGKIEIGKLEKNTGILGIIAGIAPMFGFIGTISGVIKIFYKISLADNISIGLISGGLYEKMITSAAGLVVGVFAFVGYHWLNMLIDKLSFKMEISSMEFIDMLQEPSK